MAEEFRLDEENHWYEIDIDGVRTALTHFQDTGKMLIFDHTETDPAFEGQGIAKRLVQQALDDVRAKGKKIWPLCPFVAHFVKVNPEYMDLVA
jgi:predicted GNAT family acetyltransferase